MDTTTYLALSNQLALQRHMTVVANNLANATTTGYRAERTLFGRVMERVGGGQEVSFVQDRALARDRLPGPAVATGNDLDLAIDGAGYLAFESAQGPLYGRSASLSVSPDGRLVDGGGRALLDAGGNPVMLDPSDRQVSIAADGTLSGSSGPIARLGTVTFPDEQFLERVGANLYRTDQAPSPASGRLLQGTLEGSSVKPVLEMATMLETVRAFEGAQRLLDAQHEIERQTIERTIRASG